MSKLIAKYLILFKCSHCSLDSNNCTNKDYQRHNKLVKLETLCNKNLTK